jgi:hypothetical protein
LGASGPRTNIMITGKGGNERRFIGRAIYRSLLDLRVLVSGAGRRQRVRTIRAVPAALAPRTRQRRRDLRPADRRRPLDRGHVSGPARARRIQGGCRGDCRGRTHDAVRGIARYRAPRPVASRPQRIRDAGRPQRAVPEPSSGGHPLELRRAVEYLVKSRVTPSEISAQIPAWIAHGRRGRQGES